MLTAKQQEALNYVDNKYKDYKIRLNIDDKISIINKYQNISPIIIYCTMNTIENHLYNDTHYRNYYEAVNLKRLNREYCSYSTERTSCENRLFNNIYNSEDEFSKVKYGLFDINNNGWYYDKQTHHGDCYFVLKNDIKKRSTITIGDSFTSGPHVYSFNNLEAFVDNSVGKVPLYFEVQIHGPISLSTDIEKLVVPNKYKSDNLDEFGAKNNFVIEYH
jgi:hypothetical protein